jgi:hypothetical protein
LLPLWTLELHHYPQFGALTSIRRPPAMGFVTHRSKLKGCISTFPNPGRSSAPGVTLWLFRPVCTLDLAGAGVGRRTYNAHRNHIFLFVDELDFWLAPVLYDERDQRALIRTLIEDVLAENLQRRATPTGDNEPGKPRGGNLGAYLNRYAPILKHKSFSEEREWRIISRPLFCTHERFGYRAGASMLVPYFRIPLSSEERPLRIEEVIVGPTPNPQQSTNSMRGFLVRQHLLKTRLRNSEAPYRNW